MNNPDQRITVYVVDDDTPLRNALCAFLNAKGYLTVACPSAEQFLRIFDPEKQAVLMLELQLPTMSGIDLQTHLSGDGTPLPVIAMTADADVPTAVRAMREGAVDFIEKPARDHAILSALSLAERMLFDREPRLVSKKVVADRLAKLTDRERDVLHHLLQGKLNKEIAVALAVSQRTVEGHRSRIREKMHARGIADLIRLMR